MHDPNHTANHRAMSARGGAASWQRRLAIREDSPLAPLMDVLNTTVAELMIPGIGADETRRLRSLTYAVSVAARVVELAEYADTIDELTERFRSMDGSCRLLQWPGVTGGDHEA